MNPSPCTHPGPSRATPSLPPQTARSDGHDQRGRFTPGNHCGQRNPAAKQTAALRQALRAAVSAADVTAIAGKLRELALGGNLSAIRLLLSYVVGRPGAGEEEESEPGPPPPDTPDVTEEPAPAPTEDTAAPAPVAPSPEAPVAVPPKETNPETRKPETPRPPSATAVTRHQVWPRKMRHRVWPSLRRSLH